MGPYLTLAELTSIVRWIVLLYGVWLVAHSIRKRRTDEGRAMFLFGLALCLMYGTSLLGDAIGEGLGVGLAALAIASMAASITYYRRHYRAQRKPV